MFGELFEKCVEVELSEYQPTDATGNSPLASLPGCKGVLLLSDGDDRPIQLLIAANIRRTAEIKLGGQEEDSFQKRADLKSIVKRIYYFRTYNEFRSGLVHLFAAKSIDPKGYKKTVKLVRPTLVKIDLSAYWPTFQTTEKCSSAAGQKLLGPFPNRRSANDFIKILQDSFDLCQVPQLIGSPEKASSCPYLQMSACPAPCVGRISREEYLKQIDASISAGCGGAGEQRAILEKRMSDAAAKMEFEQANRLKNQIAQLDLLAKETYRWTGELSKMNILHIDRSAKMAVKKRKKLQLFTAFLIRKDRVLEIGDFSLDAFDELAEKIATINADSSKYDSFAMKLVESELLGVTSFHLYRNNRAGVWIDCRPGGKPDPEKLRKAVCERFDIEMPKSTEDNQSNPA